MSVLTIAGFIAWCLSCAMFALWSSEAARDGHARAAVGWGAGSVLCGAGAITQLVLFLIPGVQ